MICRKAPFSARRAGFFCDEQAAVKKPYPLRKMGLVNPCNFGLNQMEKTMRNIQLSLLGMLASVLILSGCSNIEIVKRRHMPGYHVEVNKATKQNRSTKEQVEQARSEQSFETAELKEPRIAAPEFETESLSASAAPLATAAPAVIAAPKAAAAPVSKTTATGSSPSINALDKGVEFFKHELAATRTALKPSPVNRNTHWMAWVAFGAGLAAMLFGLIGLIVAIFGFSVWWLAILFGVTAIVFAIIHSKNNYQGETFRRLGLLFGIIGASLGVLGLIIWAIRIAGIFRV